jgi:hypothetical protein
VAADDHSKAKDTAVLEPPIGYPASRVPNRRAPRWYPPVVIYPVRHNNFAVIGATIGTASLFISLLPVFGVLSWLLAPLGLVASTVGLGVGLFRGAGRAGALLGIAASSVSLALGLGWLLLVRML